MTLYDSRAPSGREATYAEKEAGLLEALELEFLDECHPNMVLELIVVAKEKYARMASAS